MIRNTIVSILFLFPTLLFSQFGPGGVGNSSNNGLWLKADDITLSDGTPVVNWNDRSGNNNHATNPVIAEQTTFNLNSSINSRPSVYFDGNIDQMIVADADILDGSSGITYYSVVRPNKMDGQARAIIGKRIDFNNAANYAYTFFFYTSRYVWLDVQNLNDRISSSPITFSNNTNYMLGFDFDGSRPEAIRSRFLSAGNVIKEVKETSTAILNSNQDLILGGLNLDYNPSGPRRYSGDMSELIHYNRALNTAERKIVENYLGAKYGITIANDLYTHQAVYAGEVAGIGQDDGSNSHNDAQGSAIVRINNPSSLSDGDFMIWGHNESSLDVYDTLDVDKTIIESRMSRVWAVTKTNDVGTVNVTFDLSDFDPIIASDVRLLIDRDGDGFADNDVAPLAGTVSGSTITFTGVTFVNNDKFTLGSINFAQTPLPVELTDFHLKSKERTVDVLWTTASELNADYYLLSKSKEGKSFENFAQVKANGTKSTVSNYKERDETPFSGISYYQLTQVDFDGRATEYAPISVNRQQGQSFVLVPNPTTGAFQLKSAISTDGNTNLTIFSSVGKLMNQLTLIPEDINNKFIDLDLKLGVYFVKVNQENGYSTSLKLVVN
ncbi:T9SS type A sorting domain-containing protein [Brumimicrobium glaciale]|uniref:T9SS type A sorting domain-containing protein n=1 Tax=Brumimicrobium glaciale TaxID=200475 RepID=A0A4Q4KMA8_9FLAO|nr:T9SS type A sorting domain-containing protein [Brumimicrobium glaciale]RYM33887.1 T9SS type A sorting domain-containing protein [Brumimicrobium glaciale]